jgi:hypothetical protein
MTMERGEERRKEDKKNKGLTYPADYRELARTHGHVVGYGSLPHEQGMTSAKRPAPAEQEKRFGLCGKWSCSWRLVLHVS